jgi:hypothetical protein
MLDTKANRDAMPNADRSTWTPLSEVAKVPIHTHTHTITLSHYHTHSLLLVLSFFVFRSDCTTF